MKSSVTTLSWMAKECASRKNELGILTDYMEYGANRIFLKNEEFHECLQHMVVEMNKLNQKISVMNDDEIIVYSPNKYAQALGMAYIKQFFSAFMGGEKILLPERAVRLKGESYTRILGLSFITTAWIREWLEENPDHTLQQAYLMIDAIMERTHDLLKDLKK